jgi:hypothetical protein
MPALNISFFTQLQDDYTKYNTFIETGTNMGWTTFNMEPHFKKVYTIEISELYYNSTKSKYHGNKIEFLLGDSSDVFQSLLPTINDPTIFFLDGHWSNGNTGKGVKDIPLLEEIKHINTLFKHDAILIIDDFRLFGKGPQVDTNSEMWCGEDWSEINKKSLVDILSDRITNIYHLSSELTADDRLIIHIKGL